MFIIFEGADGTGKTTQINKLEGYLARRDIPVHKLRYNNVMVEDTKHEAYALAQYRDILELTDNSRSAFIADRFHFGEFVYGQLYRHYHADHRVIEKGFEDKIILFYLFAPALELVGREDGKSFTFTLASKSLELMLFDTAFERSTIVHKEAISTDRLVDDTQFLIRAYLEKNKFVK